MKVKIIIDLDKDARLALAFYHGASKPASREDVALWAELVITATLDDILIEYDRHSSRKDLPTSPYGKHALSRKPSNGEKE